MKCLTRGQTQYDSELCRLSRGPLMSKTSCSRLIAARCATTCILLYYFIKFVQETLCINKYILMMSILSWVIILRAAFAKHQLHDSSTLTANYTARGPGTHSMFGHTKDPQRSSRTKRYTITNLPPKASQTSNGSIGASGPYSSPIGKTNGT